MREYGGLCRRCYDEIHRRTLTVGLKETTARDAGGNAQAGYDNCTREDCTCCIPIVRGPRCGCAREDGLSVCAHCAQRTSQQTSRRGP